MAETDTCYIILYFPKWKLKMGYQGKSKNQCGCIPLGSLPPNPFPWFFHAVEAEHPLACDLLPPSKPEVVTVPLCTAESPYPPFPKDPCNPLDSIFCFNIPKVSWVESGLLSSNLISPYYISQQSTHRFKKLRHVYSDYAADYSRYN